MLLFSLNFSSYYLIFKGRLKEAFTTEIKTFLCIVAVAIAIITLNIHGMFDGVGEAVRHVSFTVASIISTTGYVTADFDLWGTLSHVIIVCLMFIGACAGSTGGGIKVSRFVIMFKGMGKELKKMLHPRRVQKVTVDSHSVDSDMVHSVNTYFVFYVIVFVMSLLLVSVNGYDIITSFTSVAATMNNIGPGLSLVGPTQNFGFLSVPTKLVLIFDMLIGRLELFPMLLLFSPATWKNK